MIGLIVVALLGPACYVPPVQAPVVDPFRAPPCTFCPGNRGLEYQPVLGTPVRAAEAGVVSFSGVVAGVRYVVVRQVDGRLATYGRLATVDVSARAAIERGGLVGTTTARFFFGLREGDVYIDPAPFLGVPRYRPRLVPLDGSAPRRAPPPVLKCGASTAVRWPSADQAR